MSSGTGSSGKATTGGAKKVLSVALAIFVFMMIAPNVDTLMATAESIGGTISGFFGAIGNLLDQMQSAFQQASAG